MMKLFRIVTAGLFLLAIWLALTIVFVLPGTSSGWIPFWVIVTVGLIVVCLIARKWFTASQNRKNRVMAGMAAVPTLVFGLWLTIANETQARQQGGWEGYLTMLGVGSAAHAVLWIFLLFRTRPEK